MHDYVGKVWFIWLSLKISVSCCIKIKSITNKRIIFIFSCSPSITHSSLKKLLTPQSHKYFFTVGCWQKLGLWFAISMNMFLVLLICACVASISLLFISFSFITSSFFLCTSSLSAFSFFSFSLNLLTASLFCSLLSISSEYGCDLGSSWSHTMTWTDLTGTQTDTLSWAEVCDIVWDSHKAVWLKQACCNLRRKDIFFRRSAEIWLQPFTLTTPTCRNPNLVDDNKPLRVVISQKLIFLWVKIFKVAFHHWHLMLAFFQDFS